MASLRLLLRHEWEQRLTALGCSKFDVPNTGLETGEFWQTEHKLLFIVPADGEGRVRMDDMQNVTAEVSRLRPIDIGD